MERKFPTSGVGAEDGRGTPDYSKALSDDDLGRLEDLVGRRHGSLERLSAPNWKPFVKGWCGA